MSLWQALLYFAREAAVNTARSWRASLLAVVTIATSLTIGGFFVLVTGNVSRMLTEWRQQLKVTVYLEEEALPEQLSAVADVAAEPPWVLTVELLDAEQVSERFRQSFDDLAEVLGSSDQQPFPPLVEATLDEDRLDREELEQWVRQLEALPGVESVDSDLEWLDRLLEVLVLARVLGLAVGLGLIVAASLTIASVVRLTAYLYLEEIAVMRLVGATEFFIRGPFYVEGLLQGALGGVLSLLGLGGIHLWVGGRAEGGVWLSQLFARFLPWQQQIVLVLIGALAGLIGAIVSLRREKLRIGDS